MSVLEDRINKATNMDIPLRQQFIAFLNTPLIGQNSLIRSPSKELVETIDDAYEECFGSKPIKPVTIGNYFSITINARNLIEQHGSDSDFADHKIVSSRALMKDFYKAKERFPLLWHILKTSVVTFGSEFGIPLPETYSSAEHNQDTLGNLLGRGIAGTRNPWWPEEISLEEYGEKILKGYTDLCDVCSIFINAFLSLSLSKEEENNEYKGNA